MTSVPPPTRDELDRFEEQIRRYAADVGTTPTVARMPMAVYAAIRRQADERGPVGREFPGTCRVVVDNRLPPGQVVLGGDELA